MKVHDILRLPKIPEIPRQYLDSYTEKSNRGNLIAARIFSVLGITMVPGSVVLDYFICPEHLLQFGLYRILIAVSCLALFLLSFLPNFRTRGKLISLLVMAVTGLGIAAMIRALGFQSPYYAGLNLIYLASIIIPWGPGYALAGCGIVFSFYLFPVLVRDFPLRDIPAFVNNTVFQLETIIVAVVGTYFQHINRRKQIIGLLTIAEQAEALSNRDKYKREFISNITHELKTPLSIVIGNADLVLDSYEGTSDSLKNQILQIQQSAFQLATHVDRIISVSLSEDPETRLNLDIYDYTGIVRHMYALFASQAQSRSIAYGLVAPKHQLIVQADMILVEEVLRNLVQNAFKYTGDNGSISVTIGSDGQSVVTEITDTGVGISPEKVDHIFDRLYQADDVLSKKHGGIGLGLFIVKRNIELHGGHISVHSVPGKGTSFRFDLPLYIDQTVPIKNQSFSGDNRRRDDRRGRQDRRAIDRRAAARAFEYRQAMGLEWLAEMSHTGNLADFQNQKPDRPTILIAEDNPGMMKVIVEALREEHNLVLAFNGIEALEKVAHFGESLSLILTDVMMPEMNGYDFCARVMENESWKRIPLIFITALMSEEDKLRGHQLGATDYLVKPYNVKILKEKVAHWISRRQYEILLKTVSDGYEQRANQLARIRDIIIHEIRNPLTVISGANFFIHAAAKSADKAQTKDLSSYAAMLADGIKALEGVLETSRELDMEKLGKVCPVLISDLVGVAGEQTRHLFSDVRLNIEMADVDGWTVRCDRQMITQVFVNLIRNGVEAIREKDSGEVGTVTVAAKSSGDNKIILTVSDNGIGMPETVRQNLFRFRYTTKKSGTGIGLHLAKMMLKLHDGSITVDSEEGKGTTFKVYLPALPTLAAQGVESEV